MTPSTTRPTCGPIAAASAPASSPPERASGCGRSRSAGGANRRYQPTSNSATPRATSTSAERTSAPDGAAATRPRPPQPSRTPPGASAMAPAIVGAERRSSTATSAEPMARTAPSTTSAASAARKPEGSPATAAAPGSASGDAVPASPASASPDAVAARPAARRARDRGRRAAPNTN